MKRLLFAVLLVTSAVLGQSPNPHCPVVFGVTMPAEGKLQYYFLPPFHAEPMAFVDHGEAQLEVTEAFVIITGKPGTHVEVRFRERRSDEAK